jgi:hypothetical protein
MKHIYILFICITCFSVYSQNTGDNKVLNTAEKNRLRTITSLKTNNLTELFQASIDNGIFSYTKSSVTIKSTLFGVKKLFNPNIAVDTSYQKQTFARNFEFSSKIGIDNANKINEVNPTIKYAIINKRDVSNINRTDLSVINLAIEDVIQSQMKILAIINSRAMAANLNTEELNTFNDLKIKYTQLSATDAGDTLSERYKISFLKSLLQKNETIYKKIDPENNLFDDLIKKSNEVDEFQKQLDDKIKRGAILTIAGVGRYKDIYWDSLNLKIEFLKGLGNNKDKDKPWDLYASAALGMKKDSVNGDYLGRQIGSVKLGVNKVLLKNNSGASFLEVLGAAEINQVVKGLYSGEETPKIFLDFTLTFRLGKTTFLPIEIKYDPKTANVFGFFKLKWDITSQN